LVCQPGIFGFVIAAMIAALMSTLDTLITAVSAIAVNDICRLKWPNREDAFYLKLAKHIALIATLVGIALIPVFNKFDSIYQALSHFTSSVIPPLAVVICLGTLWKRFHTRAAFWTLIFGSLALFVSLVQPFIITPFSHGIAPDGGYSYIRSLFGVVTSGAFAVLFTFLLPRVKEEKDLTGLMIESLDAGVVKFKGGQPNYNGIRKHVILKPELNAGISDVRVSQKVLDKLEANPGDYLYLSDTRLWLGGFRAVTLKAGSPSMNEFEIQLPEDIYETSTLKEGQPIRVQLLL